MADGGSTVRDLVNRLESTIHANEREFARLLQIGEQSSDAELDQLFLGDSFDRCQVLRKLSVTNLASSNKQGRS